MQRFLLLLFLLPAAFATAQTIVWISPCSSHEVCLNPGSCTEGNVLLAEEAVSSCPGGFVNYSYKIDLGNNGSIDIQSSADTLNSPLPLGTHKIFWRANDNCGKVNSDCSYVVTIRDCNPPNLLCLNGLTQNLEIPECASTFNVSDFILNVTDNCTPVNQLQYGLRETGTGSGFPTDTTISFGLCDQGLHVLQIWVKDQYNLTNQCNSYVLVQDNAGVCECNIDASIELRGCANTSDSLKMSSYTIRAELQDTLTQGPPANMSLQKTVTDSCFSLTFTGLPLNGSYQGIVKGQRYGSPLEGVSTFDLVLINKHILGQQSLENFYQVLAADVNQSHTVTTFDIIEIRKLILGVYDTFPSVPSWRFIRPVPDPSNLLAYNAVRDTYHFSVLNLLDDMVLKGYNFVGVKMGDANSNASVQGPADDRGVDSPPLFLQTAERSLLAGEAVWAPIYSTETVQLDGWQMALQIDPDALDIKDVRGIAPESSRNTPSGELRISQVNDTPVEYSPQQPLCEILLLAKTPVRLSNALALSAAPLAPEAYCSGDQHTRPIFFHLGKNSPGMIVTPPRPNPFTTETIFNLLLEQEQTVELEILDMSGRQVYATAATLAAGNHPITMPASALPTPGVWMYRLRGGAIVTSGRLVRM